MRVFGPRNIVEGAFLVAVPIIALAAGLTAWPIIGASTAAYLLVVAIEATLARLSEAAEEQPRPQPVPRPAPKPAPPPPPPPPPPAPEPEFEPEPEPEFPPAPEPEPELEPAARHVRVLRTPKREKEPVAPPPAAPIQRPAWSNVVPIGVPGPARRWNLWDLEKLSREHAGGDAVADEERSFLLLYLREFADADGLLPTDFDPLVRDTFGSLVTQ